MSNRRIEVIDRTTPAGRYRYARALDAPSGDPCPACHERHDSASAEADCVAEHEED